MDKSKKPEKIIKGFSIEWNQMFFCVTRPITESEARRVQRLVDTGEWRYIQLSKWADFELNLKTR